jgi:hypothetical protein
MHLVELSRREHRGLRIRSDRVESCVSAQHLIPIVVSEFRKAAIQYPIVFAKSPETGRFGAYALNGLAPEENLFWTGTELDVAYVPLNVRRQPFYVGTDDAGKANVLCIDLDSPCVDPEGTKTLVDADGGDSAYLKEMLAILHELVAVRSLTEQFIETALALDLLVPITLDIVLDDGTPLQAHGLYGLDEERFRQLGVGEVGKLWQNGSLALFHAVLISSGQIFRLIQRKNKRIALSRAWQGPG